MTLQTCPDCGHQVSSSALACPNCGRPFAVTVGTQSVAGAALRKWLGIVLVIVVLLVLYAIAAPRG